MKANGVGRLLVVPLYPQYAASSAGAALDKVLNELTKQRNQMSLRTVSRFTITRVTFKPLPRK